MGVMMFSVLPFLLFILQVTTGASTSPTRLPERRHIDSPAHLQYMTYYGCEPATQAGHTNLCITHNSSLLLAANATGMAGMLQVTWAFFRNAVPPRVGLQLRADYEEGWSLAWAGSSNSSEWKSGRANSAACSIHTRSQRVTENGGACVSVAVMHDRQTVVIVGIVKG